MPGSAATDAEPTAPAMLVFGWRLTETQVADVLSYIRNGWGNAAPSEAPTTVRTLGAPLEARHE